MSASAVIILQKSSRLSTLLEERLGVKGHSLDTRLLRAGRVLPRDARIAGHRIAKAERKARASGQIIEIDPHQFDDDYRLCMRRIEAIQPDALRQAVRGGAPTEAIAVVSVIVLYAAMVGNFFFS